MNNVDKSFADNKKEYEKAVDKGLIQLLLTLLCDPRIPEDVKIHEDFLCDPDFQKLYTCIVDLRELSAALNKGDLHMFVYGKGFILSNLKALQSNLRHLTWQTKKVAEGDFSQRVDFLGDFSDSFNEMTIKLKDANEQLLRLASLDPLTNIPNRMALDQFLISSFTDAKAKSKALSVLLMDIDYFKQVNDTYGHMAGDEILIKISEVLNQQFRATDVFARYGGEEFIAVLPNADIDTAVKIGNRALQAVAETVVKIDSERELSVTISMGVSCIHPEDEGCEDIIKRSDVALYKAKGSGKNRLCTL